MTLQHVDIVFQVMVFLFAISFHESAHAWMANRCGDPTARSLGRVSLNPLRHIDIFGTVILPLLALVAHIPVIGWAKPTPVDPSNFRRPVRDDILTSVVGPASNFVIAIAAFCVLLGIAALSPLGAGLINTILITYPRINILAAQSNSWLVPFSLLVYEVMFINVILGVFNLIPVPPLDGSHVLRHILPVPVRRVYDTVGWLCLLALVYFGGTILWRLIGPVLRFFDAGLLAVIRAR